MGPSSIALNGAFAFFVDSLTMTSSLLAAVFALFKRRNCGGEGEMFGDLDGLAIGLAVGMGSSSSKSNSRRSSSVA